MRELFLYVIASLDFRYGSESRVRAEDEIDVGGGPPWFSCFATTCGGQLGWNNRHWTVNRFEIVRTTKLWVDGNELLIYFGSGGCFATINLINLMQGKNGSKRGKRNVFSL